MPTSVTRPLRSSNGSGMTKAVSILFGLLVAVQIVRPLGLPGLTRRVDAWKLAVAALAIFALVALSKGE